LSSGNILRHRPDGSTLSHVESTHGFLIGRKLIGVENSSTSYQTGVTVFLKPLGSKGGTLSSENSRLGITCLFNGLQFLVLSGFIVGGGGETKGLPDGVDTRRSKVCLTDEGKVDSESGKAEKRFALGGLLLGLVHLVTKTILVKCPLETNLRDACIRWISASPGVFKTDRCSLEEAKVFRNKN
jgi:hypothetical protein